MADEQLKVLQQIADQLREQNKDNVRDRDRAQEELRIVGSQYNATKELLKQAKENNKDDSNTKEITRLTEKSEELLREIQKAKDKKEEAEAAITLNEQVAADKNINIVDITPIEKSLNPLIEDFQKNQDVIEGLDREIKDLEETLEKAKESADKETIKAIKDALTEKKKEKTKVQRDPNTTPQWVQKLLGQNTIFHKESLEKLGSIQQGFSELGSKIADGLSNLPGMDAAKGFFSAIGDLAKKVLIAVGAFTALNGFLDGMEKAKEWFGDDANFKEIFASGLAGIAEAFGLVTEGDAKALAEKIVSVFQWIEDKIVWMFEGVKQTFGGIVEFVKKLGGISDQFQSGDIMGGFSSLWETIKTDLFGNLNMGFAAAFALIAPKATMALIGFLAKSVIPSALSFLSGTLLPALGSFATALAPMLAAIGPMLVPIALITSAFVAVKDAVSNTLAVFDQTGSVVEAIKTGVSTLFGKLIGFVPDLIKDIVSWGAEKLGFENFAADLDSFSFADAITDGMIDFMDYLQGFVDDIKIGFYSLLNKIPGFRGDFDEDIKALEEGKENRRREREELQQQRDQTIEAQRVEQDNQDLATRVFGERPEQQIEPAALQNFGERPEQQIEPAALQSPEALLPSVEINSKPITDGFKAMEKAFNAYTETVDAEIAKQNSGVNAVVNTNNSRKVVNNSTTAVSAMFNHRNIGATRGMFGAPSTPLSSPN